MAVQVLLCQCHVRLPQNIQTNICSKIIVDVLKCSYEQAATVNSDDLYGESIFLKNIFVAIGSTHVAFGFTLLCQTQFDFAKTESEMWVSVLYLTVLLCWSTTFASSLCYFEEAVNHMISELWFVPQEIAQWRSYFKIFFKMKLTAPPTVSQISAWPAPSAHPPRL